MNSEIILDSEEFTSEELEDIKRCLETLLSIIAGTQPLDRELGIDINEITAYPTEVAKNKLSVEIVKKVRIYEPRVDVKSIEYTNAEDGSLVPHIHFIRVGGTSS